MDSGLALRDLVEAMPDGALLTDAEHRIVMVNDDLLALFGYSRSELIGSSVDVLLPERLRYDHAALRLEYRGCPIRRPLQALSPGFLKGQRQDGEEFPVEVSLSPIRVGTRTYIACSVRDLSDRLTLWRRMEDERAAVLSQVFDALPAMAFALTTEPDDLRPNQVLMETLGWSAAELMTHGLRSCIPDVRSRARFRRLVRDPTPGWHKVGLRTRDGTSVESVWSVVRVSPTLITGMGIDVTEKVEMEARLRVANKMGAVGQLAGGVAHDFNNLLTVISGRGQMVMRALNGKGMEEALSDIRQILQSAKSATALTRQLLTFSRTEKPGVEVLAPSAVAIDMEGLLRRLLRADIDFRVEAGASTSNVACERVLIEQILLNLVVNARDAIEGSGQITVTVEDVEVPIDHSRTFPAALTPGAYARVSVRDTGAGMNREIAARMFDPFFTTKASGTGLGLATVRDIVEKVGGIAAVDSVLEVGTTVTIYLPRIVAEASAPPTDDVASDASRVNVATILLVEDSAGVRRLMADVLRARGHSVLEASDGVEALSIVESGICDPDLVLTDIVMPKMRGPELVRRLRTRNPHLQALYVSGYAQSRSANLELAPHFTDFLIKPFEPTDLLRQVDSLLWGDPAFDNDISESR